jgi:beta-glucanase (GH16 family)
LIQIKNILIICSVFFTAFIYSSCKKDPEEEIELIAPSGYQLLLRDEFDSFNSNNWSKGLKNDVDDQIRMIWNQNTGGENLLNDNYAGYILDENTYVENGCLFLENRKETINGTDPIGVFEYTTGWINSLHKINFNGTQKSIYIEVKAKFPTGDKVWPAIWLIDDSENRTWPPEIDVWEYFGQFFNTNQIDEMYMRYIYGTWNNKEDHSTSINNFQLNYNASANWHIYGFKWSDNSMEWYIDQALVHTKTKGIEIPSDHWPDKPMCLVINNGLLNVVEEGNTIFPNQLVLDYIRIFENLN